MTTATDVPPLLADALQVHPDVAARWQRLPSDRQHAHALAVENAATEMGRARRVAQVLDALLP